MTENKFRSYKPQYYQFAVVAEVIAPEFVTHPMACVSWGKYVLISLCLQEGAARPLGFFPMLYDFHIVHIPLRGEGRKRRNQLIKWSYDYLSLDEWGKYR